MRKCTEMEERVARAMLAEASPGDMLTFLDEINEFPEKAFTRLARIAIRSMSTPTQEMIKAGMREIPAGHGQAWIYFEDAWAAAVACATLPPDDTNTA